MKLILASLFIILMGCRKNESVKVSDESTYRIDSIGFEDYTVGKWTVPYHPSITGYEPLSGALSLYGYFSKEKEFSLISPEYKLKKNVTVKFLYKMYTGDNLVNGRVSISFNGKEYLTQPLTHSSIQSFDRNFEISPDQQGKITISFLQEAEAGKNIWVDDLIVISKP